MIAASTLIGILLAKINFRGNIKVLLMYFIGYEKYPADGGIGLGMN